jgi:hypothetical protein
MAKESYNNNYNKKKATSPPFSHDFLLLGMK